MTTKVTYRSLQARIKTADQPMEDHGTLKHVQFTPTKTKTKTSRRPRHRTRESYQRIFQGYRESEQIGSIIRKGDGMYIWFFSLGSGSMAS